MTAGPELAGARVRQLTRLTEDLTDRLIRETRAFEARGEVMPEGYTEGYGLPYSVLLLFIEVRVPSNSP